MQSTSRLTPLITQLLAPRETSRLTLWLETLMIPLLGIALAWGLRPEDPALLSTDFAWLWFAPVLVALRYGVMPGLIACLVLIAHWFLLAQMAGGPAVFPQNYFFGGILLVLLCGEFADVWRDRNLRLEETNIYLSERVSRLTRRHLLLNLSHDRLEQEMLTRPGSLRDALGHLRTIILNAPAARGDLPALPELLHLLAQYTGVQGVAVYAAGKNGDLRLDVPAALLGDPIALTARDELLTTALEHGELAHVAESVSAAGQGSPQLLVAPLLASDQTLLGVLAVSKLPFLSLNIENLQLISIILGYYSDIVRSAPGLADLKERMPTIPPMFAEEMLRMIALQRRFGIDTQIVVMRFSGPQGNAIVEQLLRIKRGLDLYWQSYVDSALLVAVLMPFASPSGKEGFLQRIGAWLSTRFAGDFESLQIGLRTIDFATDDPVSALAGQMGT